MRAVGIKKFGGPEVLEILDVPKPSPKADEILIQIMASGVNPVDWKIRGGYLKDVLPHEFPVILGWDAAGTVEEIGSSSSNFKVGDNVFSYTRLPTVSSGTYAEFIAVPANQVALMPKNLSFEESAAIPLAGLTAYQSLFEAGKLQKGETVLIHGASGGVGSFAVQLAHNAGATVIATASRKNHEYLNKLGANEVIDYTNVDFRDVISSLYPDGINLVFDCVGGSTLKRSCDILKPGGRLVNIVQNDDQNQVEEQLKKSGSSYHYVFVSPNAAQLAELSKMAEEGKLHPDIAATFSLDNVEAAHKLSESGHTRGKIVLKIQTH